MQILFLHAATNKRTPEYRVHQTLAESLSEPAMAAYFICQRTIALGASPSGGFSRPDRVRYADFGRDFSSPLPPSRSQRARMMAQTLPSALRTVACAIRQIHPDLIYTSQQSYDVRLAQVFARLFRIPHVIHLHYTVGPWLGNDILNIIRRSQYLIVVSEFIRQTAMLQGGNPAAIHTIPNTITPIDVPEPLDRRTLRSQFGWAADDPVVISVARLDPMKGHPELIQAFATVVRQVPNARLLLCGTTSTRDDYAQSLRAQVSDLGLQSSVTFAGHRDDIPALLLCSDIFCSPSQMEPFGMVFLEAMLASLPVVAATSGAVPEIVIDEQTGLLSYPDQIDVLAANILRLLRNPDLATSLGAAGKARASSRFAPSSIAPRWAEILHSFVHK